MEKDEKENVKIPLKETLFLSPLEKYKLYGRFPWKMVMHIALVIATTTQVNIILKKAILTLSNTSNYARAQERLLYSLFIDPGADKTDLDYKRFIYLFSIGDLRDHLKTSIQNYYKMRENSLQNITYPDDEGSLYITLELKYLEKDNNTLDRIGKKFNITFERRSIHHHQFPSRKKQITDPNGAG